MHSQPQVSAAYSNGDARSPVGEGPPAVAEVVVVVLSNLRLPTHRLRRHRAQAGAQQEVEREAARQQRDFVQPPRLDQAAHIGPKKLAAHECTLGSSIGRCRAPPEL
eukprot:2035101-Pyramimonas_sp.AAC.2